MKTSPGSTYIGRFAPSPTGPLHFGSLVAALGSYLDARAHGGRWLLRIEDVDGPRCSTAAAGAILQVLEAYGFEWDGPVVYQSQRGDRYREVMAQLQGQGAIYPCGCTRKELAGFPLAPDGAVIYPGICRRGLASGRLPRAWRLNVGEERVDFADAVQGRQHYDMPRDFGDFVLLRADGYFAYQLAVVVDDADQGVTHVVRGADLLHSTPRQILLQHRLAYAVPQYAHLPVAVDAAGEKLSKQTLAAPIDVDQPMPALAAALGFLGQAPLPMGTRATNAEFYAWAIANWSLDRVPRVPRLPAVIQATAADHADGKADR